MELTKTLIDRAAKVCGSRSKLAGKLGVSRQLLTDWKMGKSVPTEVHIGKMAIIAGVRIEEALLARSQDQLAKTEEGRQILDVMKGGFLAGGPEIFVTSATESVGELRQKVIDGICIVLTAGWHKGRSLFSRTMKPASVA